MCQKWQIVVQMGAISSDYHIPPSTQLPRFIRCSQIWRGYNPFQWRPPLKPTFPGNHKDYCKQQPWIKNKLKAPNPQHSKNHKCRFSSKLILKTHPKLEGKFARRYLQYLGRTPSQNFRNCWFPRCFERKKIVAFDTKIIMSNDKQSRIIFVTNT